MGFRSKRLDALIVGGGLSSLFTGIVNPSYIKLILSNLDLKVLSLGSLISAGLPFLTGMLLENRRLYARMYALLPAVMAAEVVLTVLATLVFAVDAAAWYLTAMIVFGLFSSTVMHLLQELKQRRYRRGRAAFERRASMADALGYLVGSALVFTDTLVIEDVWIVLLLGFIQTALVYVLYMRAYRQRVRRAGARRSGSLGTATAAAAGRSAPLSWLPAALRWPAALRPGALPPEAAGGMRPMGSRFLSARDRPEAIARSTIEELECPVPAG